jgi:hypothetical protein
MIGNGNTGQAASNASHAVLYGACGGPRNQKAQTWPGGEDMRQCLQEETASSYEG